MSYVLPVIDRTGGERVTTLPHRYVLSPRGEYVHLPRSAALWPDDRRGQGERLTVDTLCGQLLHRPIVTDEPVGPHCATCFGRGLATVPGVVGLAWRPRGVHWLPKRWCRGPRLGLTLVDRRTWDAYCLSCGTEGRYRGGYGLNGRSAQVQHEHQGTGLACPTHGQRDLWLPAGTSRVECRAWVGGGGEHEDGRCHRAATRFWILTDHHEACS